MKVVILCGGQGTRLRDITELMPKPMSPVGDRPILWHIMKIYSHYGIKEFILCLGYKGWKIKEFFLNFQAMTGDFTVTLGDHKTVNFHQSAEEAEWKVTLAETGDDTMTGARLWKVRKYLEQEDHFCLTYGDGVADVNVSNLIEFHKKRNAIGTITGVRPMSRYGRLSIKDDLAVDFDEKAGSDEAWVNGGFMVFDAKRVWDYFWPEDHLVLEKEPLPAMVKDRQLSVYRHDGFWVGMDTMREYTLLNDLWTRGKAPWKVWK